jgi:4-oxalomesaconate hydratase
MLSHSQYDPYNTDHMYMTQVALEARMIAQAWGHNPGEKVLGAPQLYLFEPHQTEQMGWKPDVFLDITSVWDKKRKAMECNEGQIHLWEYYTRVAQQRANHFKRNSGGQAGGRDCRYAEGFQSIFPRTVDEL